MASPFPGMNPYLEEPGIWSGVHHWLINSIARALSPQLRPGYIVAVEERTYETIEDNDILVRIPDNAIVQTATQAVDLSTSNIAIASPSSEPVMVTLPIPETVRECYLEIRQVGTGEVVTAIEILSPKNKKSGIGRQKYLQKRQRIFASLTHFIEIDLLRSGEAMPILSCQSRKHYRILVSRSELRPQGELYEFNLPDRIPVFPLPLKLGDTADGKIMLDLQSLLHELYDLGSYDLRCDYRCNPIPALSKSEADWVEGLLREQGLRSE